MAKEAIGVIETGRVTLSALAERDLELTLGWRNQDRVRTSFITSHVLTAEAHQKWFREYSAKENDFVFVISERGRPVGQVALYDIDTAAGTATFGRLYIGEEDAIGRGLASAASRAVLTLAFGPLKLREVHLEVFKSNERAISLYQQLGFAMSGAAGGLLIMTLSREDYVRPAHTVILGSYNRPRMIRRAIASILQQSDFQLIVADDGSNEETLSAIRESISGNAGCYLFTQPHQDDALPRSECANRAVQRINDAIPWVQGRIVNYLADDDFYHQERFAAFNQLFSNPEVYAGYGRLTYVDGAGRDLGMTRYPASVSDPLGSLDHNQVAHRREVFDRLPQWADAVDYASEGHFFRAISRIWKFHGTDRVVAFKTEHDLNMTTTKQQSTGRRE